MAEFAIATGSPIAGQSVQEADRFDNLTFAAVLREDEVVIPTGETRIESGDSIVVIGTSESLRALAAEIQPHSDGVSDVLIAGGSNIGYQTAKLLGDTGIRPCIVERDPDRARKLAEDLPDATVMENDATDRSFLERERIKNFDVFVGCLGSDARNLIACQLADQLGVTRTVAVVEDPDYVNLFEDVGVDVAVHPREVVAEEITRFTRERYAENVSLIEDDRAEVIEVEIDADSALAERPIRESVPSLPSGVVVGAIIRDGEFVTPRGDTVIRAGDNVVAFIGASARDKAIATI